MVSAQKFKPAVENMDAKVEDDDGVLAPVRAGKATDSQRRPLATGKSRKPASLACLNCRPRKIKCLRIDGACERCRLLKLPCRVPDRDERKVRYSKEYIESLESEIAELRATVKRFQLNETTTSDAGTSDGAAVSNSSPDEIKTPPSEEYSTPNNLIEHICGVQRRRDGNGDGQSRYFGPTSSLHFTETPHTVSMDTNAVRNEVNPYENLPQDVQELCMNLYWTYQHPVLCCIHKEAFLDGMKAGRGPYFSRCLLYCILASGARISDRQDIRAMAIPTTEHEKLERRSVS